MIAVMIEGCTRILGKAQGYLGLPVRDERRDEKPAMTTAWELMPDEIAAITAGAKIEITILGTIHPPILVGVGKLDTGAASR